MWSQPAPMAGPTASSRPWTTWAPSAGHCALGLVALVGVRSAILLSIIPGLLAALAIVYIGHIQRPTIGGRSRFDCASDPSWMRD